MIKLCKYCNKIIKNPINYRQKYHEECKIISDKERINDSSKKYYNKNKHDLIYLEKKEKQRELKKNSILVIPTVEGINKKFITNEDVSSIQRQIPKIIEKKMKKLIIQPLTKAKKKIIHDRLRTCKTFTLI